MLLQPDDTIVPVTLAEIVAPDSKINHNRRFSFRAGALREWDIARETAHKRDVADYRIALQRLRNLGEAAKMVDGRTVASIAREALEGKAR